jgi:hypothetical protein
MGAIAKAFGVSVAFFTEELTDAQAQVAAWAAAGYGLGEQMTTDQMERELRAAANGAIQTVTNRWAASGAVVQAPCGTQPAGARLLSAN